MIFYFICIILICIILYLLRKRCTCKKEGFNSTEFPKTIWTFWDDNEIPSFVKCCISSWKKHNPEYKVITVNKETVKDYIKNVNIDEIKFIDSPQRYSDVVRLCLLAEHGGVWCDASTMMQDSLHWLEKELKDKDFVGFYLDGFTSRKEYPVIESWFFACKPKTKFIEEWKKEFLRIEQFDSISDYLTSCKSEIDFQNITMPSYLAIHISAQYVMQKILSTESLKLLKAEDNPYFYLTQVDWNSQKAMENFCKGEVKTSLIKFRSGERKALEKLKYKSCNECTL